MSEPPNVMPSARSPAQSASATTDHRDGVDEHLTKSILTLQRTMCNLREDFASGIAPSFILPADAESDINTGMVMLSLEPSAEAIKNNLTPIEERLKRCEMVLKARGHWRPPVIPPKSPEYSIIDINDLSSATKLIEDIIEHTNISRHLSPQPYFSQHAWTWNPIWKEFYTHISSQSTYIYLSRWHLDEQRQIWEHVSMAGTDLMPDAAAEMLGAWEDWKWDPIWKEWYLDFTEEDERNELCHVYASQWQVQESGEWLYMGRFGNTA